MALRVRLPSLFPKQLTVPFNNTGAGIHPELSSVVIIVMVLSQPAAFGMTVTTVPTADGSQLTVWTVALEASLTVTVALALPTQPFSVAVAVKVLVVVGETLIIAVFSPLLQLKLPAPEAVSVVPSPLQMLVLPEMLTSGAGFTVILKF